MHRKPLQMLLDDYAARYPHEAAVVDRFTEFVAAHADCFERSLAVGHLTGSAWVVDPAGRKTLLTHHRKLGRWLQLGGHADGVTDLLAVALAEAREESGLSAFDIVDRGIFDLDVHRIPARRSDAAHDHFDVRFALRAVTTEPLVISDESHDLAWVEIDDLKQYTQEPSMLRMAHKWRTRGNG